MHGRDPLVVGIILNWNNYPDTSDCLDSLLASGYQNLDLMVVDNGSIDGSGQRIEREYPTVEVIYNEENLGFAGGNNVGLAVALERNPDYVWLLNDDVVAPQGKLLTELVQTMEDEPTIGLLTPLVTEYPDTDEVWFEQGFIDWRSGNVAHNGKRKWFVDLRRENQTPNPQKFDREELFPTDYIPLCATLIRPDAIRDNGRLPEQYFLYYEDAALATAARNNGYELATHRGVRIHHKVSAGTDSTRSPTHLYYLARNRILFKNQFPERFSSFFYLLLGWWTLLNAGREVARLNIGHLIALARGLRDGILGRGGRGPYPRGKS